MDAKRKSDVALWSIVGINVVVIALGLVLNQLLVAGAFLLGSIVTGLLIYLYVRYAIKAVVEGEALERITQYITGPQ